jgi:hypothetical protein
MTIIRLANGADVSVKLTMAEARAAIDGGSGGFVELPGEDGPVLVRPQAVIAIIEDAKRGAAGFRVSPIASQAG